MSRYSFSSDKERWSKIVSHHRCYLPPSMSTPKVNVNNIQRLSSPTPSKLRALTAIEGTGVFLLLDVPLKQLFLEILLIVHLVRPCLLPLLSLLFPGLFPLRQRPAYLGWRSRCVGSFVSHNTPRCLVQVLFVRRARPTLSWRRDIQLGHSAKFGHWNWTTLPVW